MEFFVNSQKIDITLENEKTVGDVLKAFETEFEANNATTIGIILNGKNVEAKDFDDISSQELTDSTKLELSIITFAEIQEILKTEAMEGLKISESIKDISVKLQSGKDKEASILIAQLADFIDRFCKTAKMTAYFPEKFEFLNDDKSLENFFAEIPQILGDFQQAIESNDTVLIGDLSEYEISPRIASIVEKINQI